MSSPPKPARRVSFIRYSFRRTRRTFSTMIRLSFRLTFASAGISRHLFQDNLEVHGVLVPWTAAAVRPRTEAFRRRALMSVDHADDHRIGILFPGELRVRDRALEDLEERLRCLHRIAGRPDTRLVRDPPVVLLHRHGLLQCDDLLKVFAGVVDLLAAELRENRDVAAMRAHCLVGPVRADLLDEGEALLIDAAHERAPGPRRQELDDLFEGHRLHLVERVPAVCELLLAPRLD